LFSPIPAPARSGWAGLAIPAWCTERFILCRNEKAAKRDAAEPQADLVDGAPARR
jgi:hypothetical protein